MDDNVTVVYMDYDETMKDHISSPNYESGNPRLNTLFKFKADGSSKRFCRSFAKTVELSMEVPDVLDSLDDDTTSQSTTNEHKRVLERFNSAAPSAIFNQQPRPHLFTIIFGRQCAGITRWDRSGSLVTQKFDYVQHPRTLDHFLGHFMHTSATQRGHDTTATRILASSDNHRHRWERAYVPQTNAPGQLVQTLRALLTDPERKLTLKRLDQREGTWEFMSANSLNDPRRAIVVEDDMESFFHLLLFCAIRHLPHNFQDVVPAFMHEYFEAYSMSAGECFCGAAKLSAMTCGRFVFPNTVGCLTFYLPAEHGRNFPETAATPATTSAQNTPPLSAESSSPRLHPINAAHYALANELENLRVENSEVSAPSVDEVNVEPTEEERWFMEEYGMDDEEEEDDEEALDVDELSPEQRTAFKKLAKKLKAHKDVLGLFKRAMARSKKFGAWPRRDKIPDQLCSEL